MRMYHPRQLEKENDYNNYSTTLINQRKQSPYQQVRLGQGILSQSPSVCVVNNLQANDQVYTLNQIKVPKTQLIQNRQLYDQQQSYFGDYSTQGQKNLDTMIFQTPEVKQYVSKFPQYYLDKTNQIDYSGQHKQTRSQNSVYSNQQMHETSLYQDEDSMSQMSIQKPNSQLKKIVGVKKSNQKSQCNLNLTFTQGQRQQSYCNLNSVIHDRSQNRIKVTLQATTSRNTSPQLKHIPTVSGVQSHTKSNSRIDSNYGLNSKKNSSSSNQLNNKNNISLMMNRSNVTNDEVDLTYTNTQRSGIHPHLNSHRTQSLVPQNLFKKYNYHQDSTDLGYQPSLQSNYSQSSLPLNNFSSVGQTNTFNIGRLLFNEHFQQNGHQDYQSNRQESSLNKRNLSFNQLLDSQRQTDKQQGYLSRQQFLLSSGLSSGRKCSSQVPERIERPITRFNSSGQKDENEIQNMVETLKQNILKDLQEVSKRFLSKEGKQTDQQIIEDNNNRFSFNQTEYNQFTNHLLSKQIQKQSQQSLLRTSISSQQSSGKKQYNKLVNSDVAKQCFQREGAELFNQLSQVINNGKEFFSQITAPKAKKTKEEEFNSPSKKKVEEKLKSNTPSFQKHLRTSSYKRILPSPLQLSFNMVEPIKQNNQSDLKVAIKPPIPELIKKNNNQDFEESPVCIKIKRKIESIQESQKSMGESLNNPLSQEEEEFKDENGPQTRRESCIVEDTREDLLSIHYKESKIQSEQDTNILIDKSQQHFETPQPNENSEKQQSQDLSEFHDAEPEEEQIFLQNLQKPTHLRQKSSLKQVSTIETQEQINAPQQEEEKTKQEDVMIRHCSFKPDLATLLTKEECQDIHKIYLSSFVVQERNQQSQGSSASFESQNQVHQQQECNLEQRLKSPVKDCITPSKSQLNINIEEQQIIHRHQQSDRRQQQSHSASRQENHSATRQDRYQQLIKNFREYRVQSGHTSAVKIEPTQLTTPKASNSKGELQNPSQDVCHISDFIIYQHRESMQTIQHMRTPSLHRPAEEFQIQINPKEFISEQNQESIQVDQTSQYTLPQDPSTTEFMQDSNLTNPAASRLITFSQNDSDSEQPSTQQSFSKMLSQQIEIGSGGKLQMNNRPYFKVNPIIKRERHPCPSFREVLRERDRSNTKKDSQRSNVTGQSERDVQRKINFLNYCNNQEGSSLNFQVQTEEQKKTPRGKGMSFMEYKMQKQV